MGRWEGESSGKVREGRWGRWVVGRWEEESSGKVWEGRWGRRG